MYKKSKKVFVAVDGNNITDKYSKVFGDQNVRQFGIDEEIPLSGDKLTGNTKLNKHERETYKKVLVGLTLLDTHQGGNGMMNIALAIDNLHAVAVLQFMGMMEQMHAKSYSSIFSTLATSKEIDELFIWAKNEPTLQKKLQLITQYYENIYDDESLYMAMVASVFLESFLFYSGFFYILFLAGKGLMINSCEIINLIIRDEAIHGLYIGLLATEIYKNFSPTKQKKIKEKVLSFLQELMKNEKEYTKIIYSSIDLVEEVEKFLEYNANKALQNLSFENFYSTKDKDVNPIVFNGLRTTTKNHDFFSTKGNGYIKTTKVEEVKDEDFIF